MEKIKMNVGTMVALVLVAAAVSGLLINFGMVQAGEEPEKVKANIEAEVELEKDGEDVNVEVKAKGLTPDASFTVRAYIDTVTNCMRGGGNALASFNVASDGDGEFDIEVTIVEQDVTDVGSVSIRSAGSPPSNPPVVCFQNIND